MYAFTASSPGVRDHLQSFSLCEKPADDCGTSLPQVGGVFALYCLYKTQPGRERVYLPLAALERLTDLVPRLHAEGFDGMSREEVWLLLSDCSSTAAAAYCSSGMQQQ